MFFYRRKNARQTEVGRVAIDLAVRCVVLTFCVVSCSTILRANEAEQAKIERRAAEIAPFLADDLSTFANLADRERWEKLASTESGKRVVRDAESLLKQASPELPETLYKEYYQNGNRTNYQREYGKTTRRISTFALAEALENKGRFVAALDAELTFFCSLPSWVLPAHDANAENYDGKTVYSDLGSTLSGGEAALATNLLREKLTPETVAAVEREVERRILTPYEEAVAAEKPLRGMWWVRTENNWNAVCSAGTVAAAFALVPSKERRARFVAATEYFSENFFMKGFTNDGYCSEGMGYWNYGFGNYLYLGGLVRVATGGRVDFFRFPKIPAVLNYGPTLEIDKGNYAVFADCAPTARPSALYVGYLSRLKHFGWRGFERAGLDENFQLGDLMQTFSIGFDKELVFPTTPAALGENPALPIRSEFPDAGVLICRPNPNATGNYFAIALKGGHNAEMHNHNDVGSYSILFGNAAANAKTADVYVSRDPGGETYSARTFGSRRYEGELLNSFGHPVPRIAGTLQKTGRDAAGKVVETSYSDATDVFKIDATSAYPVPELKSATRTFVFNRATGADAGSVEILDFVEFNAGKAGSFETALITFEKFDVVSQTETSVVVAVGGAKVEFSATGADGKALPIRFETKIVGEKDDSVPKKPTRLAVFVDVDVSQATIFQRFTER